MSSSHRSAAQLGRRVEKFTKTALFTKTEHFVPEDRRLGGSAAAGREKCTGRVFNAAMVQ